MEADLDTRLKAKGLSESSIKLYLRNLQKLSGQTPLKNLTFLKDVTGINEQLSKYKPNTIRNYIISIVSILGLDKDKKGKKKLYETYAQQLVGQNRTLKAEEATNTKTPTQEANWIDWKDVEAKWEEMKKKIETFKSAKELSESQYNQLLEFVILSLYVCLPPRRNEYLHTLIVQKAPEDTANNYLDLDKKAFVFNKYKTVKREGSKTLELPTSLQEVLHIYFRFHPLLKGKHSLPQPFLVYSDGKPLTAVNSITRVLNKVFGKRVGSSMLRHAYLTGKYGAVREDMKEDANAMGHTVETQQTNYVKK